MKRRNVLETHFALGGVNIEIEQIIGAGFGLFIAQMISMLVFIGIFLWSVAQHVLLEMPFLSILKNSFLLNFRYLGKSILASGFALIYLLIIVLMFPGSVFLLVTAGLWLGLLICFQIIYPTLDELFEIEKKINEKMNQK